EAFSEGPGKGCEFAVTLPRYAGEEDSQAAESEKTRAPAQQCRVLVVDDNVDAAEVMAVLLRHFGHEVMVVHDGVGVLDVVRAFLPQVVLLDIGLPGLHGYEVARLIRREFRREQLPLVALTGYGQEVDRRRSGEAGFDQHLVKPVEAEVIRKLIDENLRC